MDWLSIAQQSVARCRALAAYTEDPGHITRTFLSPPMHGVHAEVRSWMEAAGMTVRVDGVGNIRGAYAGRSGDAPILYMGSHLDTVPRGGAFDGILGVVLAIALVESLGGRRFGFAIEVVGFSEEEGVRFGVPFLGSRAFTGDLDAALVERIAPAIRDFGLDAAKIPEARASENAVGYVEFHIEQGPVLERRELPIGVVDAIAGQSRFDVMFQGQASHAATPMSYRRDALAAAAEWVLAVERAATEGVVTTVGRFEVDPGATNVVAGTVRASLDVRHATDEVRRDVVCRVLHSAEEIAARRRVMVSWEQRLDRAAVPMDSNMRRFVEQAVEETGYPVHVMSSGAGHDAMVVAAIMPAAILFIASPGGISHHPDENVFPADVAVALRAGAGLLDILEASHG
jgi:allantoate deiminase